MTYCYLDPDSDPDFDKASAYRFATTKREMILN